MKKDIAVELIKDFHERSLPDLIDRDLSLKPPSTKKAITIIGPRRAGKTYFLFNNMLRLRNVNRTEMLYVNLEDDRLLPLNLDGLGRLLDTYYEIYPQNRKKTLYLFLDEIQNVDKWELFVRRVLDNENVQVYITGSSSKLLAKEIATTMRGRATSFVILPFSFPEFLRAKGTELEKHLSSEKRTWIMKYLNEFVKFGGFPEVVLDENEDSKVRTLKEYVEVLLMRDVVERHKVKNIKVLRMLFGAIHSSFSKEFSVHKFYNFLKSQGIAVSKNTLYEYFQHYEDAFAVIAVRRFSHSIRKMEQSLPKVYQIDNGYAAQMGVRFSQNIGRLMENTVAIELLRRRSASPLLEFFYWKDAGGKEVDFIVKKGERVMELVQVCYDIEDYTTKARETSALIKASDELGCKKLKIITWDYEEKERVKGKNIEYIPLWKWLLGRS
ncbi:MAG: ATP-binding protein [Thermoplasmata archaeon]|nr:MAG: ATP-binding protein [Thermoplasmata archaeon]